MEHILLIYSKQVAGLTSSALQKQINKPIEDIVLKQINIEKEKLKNYIKKHKVDTVYLHSHYHKRLKEEIKSLYLKDIDLVEYNSDLEYIAKRVKGNKFKTIEYYLYEYIKYRGKHPMDLYIIEGLEIKKERVDLFTKMFPHIKGKKYYITREEASENLIKIVELKYKEEYKKIIKHGKNIETHIKLKKEAELKADNLVNILIQEGKKV